MEERLYILAVLPAVTITCAIVFGCAFKAVGEIAAEKSPADARLITLQAMAILTVLVIVTAAVELALLDKLTEGVVTLLTGLASYTLGSFSKSHSTQPANGSKDDESSSE